MKTPSENHSPDKLIQYIGEYLQIGDLEEAKKLIAQAKDAPLSVSEKKQVSNAESAIQMFETIPGLKELGRKEGFEDVANILDNNISVMAGTSPLVLTVREALNLSLADSKLLPTQAVFKKIIDVDYVFPELDEEEGITSPHTIN